MTRNLLLLTIGVCLMFKARAQSWDPVLKLYATQYEQEKVHIHFDKDAYLPGETIWMKAYILFGSKPSDLSKNIYFDWTDINGNLLAHNVSPVMESVSTSSFVVPADLAGGVIHVKAYTQWMLNFDSTFLFNKDIAVLSAWDGNTRPEKHFANIQFFAEGGDLINAMSSTVAFEVTDQHGKPLNVKGVIKTGNNDVIDSFATMHEGMGSFTLRPLNNENYTAIWKDEYGESHSSALPQAKSSGAVIRVISAKDNMIHFQVERPSDAPDNFKSLTVIATSHQQVVYKSVIDLSSKTVVDATFPVSELKSGILQLTVFDKHMAPFAERVVFVNNHQFDFTAQLKKELVNFNKRGRNEISIEVPDTLAANLSISVTDGGLGSDTANNIVTDFLLSSDIRGNITNPAYYFSTNTDNASLYLDLIMRTHGWRRFKWEDVIAGKLPVIQYSADTVYMALKGQVTPAVALLDAGDSITLLVITKDRKKHVLSLPVSKNGNFIQKGIFFYDTIQIAYQFNHTNKINSNTGFNLHTSLLKGALGNTHASDPDFQWSKIPDVILEKESGGLITELNGYSKLSSSMNYVFTPVNRSDQSKSGSETAAHYLQGNFPDLKFPIAAKETDDANKAADTRFVSYTVSNTAGQPAPVARKNTVNLSLDGTLVNIDDLKQVIMKEVLFIKFLQKTGPKDLPTLSITTRQSIDQNNIINNKTGFAVLTGYTPAKEFYSPAYTENAEDRQATDFRSTLYWNPHVVVDKSHRKVKLVFFNNDITNKFRVVVEGMNKEGKLTRIEEIIK